MDVKRKYKNPYYRARPAPEVQHVAKERKCLRCSTMFDSTHAGNRICRFCKHGWQDKYMPAVHGAALPRRACSDGSA
jgi:hypothetical protein